MDENTKKELVELLKSEGIDVAEETVALVVKTAFTVAKVVLPKAAPQVAVFAVPILGLVEPQVMALIDKIDGEDDPGR